MNMPRSRNTIRADFAHACQLCLELVQKSKPSEEYQGQAGYKLILHESIHYSLILIELRDLLYDARAQNFSDLEDQLDFCITVTDSKWDSVKAILQRLETELFPESSDEETAEAA